MPQTHDSQSWYWTCGPLIVSCEPLYWHLQRYPRRRVAPNRPPLVSTAVARELEEPWRVGPGRIIRFPLTRRALVVGYWQPPGELVLADEESQKLLEAVEGAHIEGITATEIAQWTPAVDALRLWDRLRARWAAFWRRPVYSDVSELMEGWEADQGWSVTPWRGGPDGAPAA